MYSCTARGSRTISSSEWMKDNEYIYVYTYLIYIPLLHQREQSVGLGYRGLAPMDPEDLGLTTKSKKCGITPEPYSII